MPTQHRVLRNAYHDSVTLMQHSDKVAALPSIRQASMVMATEGNLDLLREAGLLKDQSIDAGPNDLLIIVEGDQPAALESALDEAQRILNEKPPTASSDGQVGEIHPRSSSMALAGSGGANLALISTPGDYAAAEARKALQLGLHVMIFSDNVSLEDEIGLKQYARDQGLLMMGPDCGTAILNGVPLGFANVVKRGNIGIIAASGTGLQQVSSLIDRRGGGISQAVGTGSHDLGAKVGGITMLQALEMLAADPATKVIVLISKPPSPEVASKVLDQAKKAGKSVVVDFVGADPTEFTKGNLHGARTLDQAASLAVALASGDAPPEGDLEPHPDLVELVETAASKLSPGQKYIRGLFSGGTLGYEALLLLGDSIGDVYSNIPLQPEYKLADVWASREHTVIDLGDDVFTMGRPHPMIDFRLRNERLIKEAADPETAVILLDVVLGYGAHNNPAAELDPAIREAFNTARSAGRDLIIVGSVCGTQGDPQNLGRQEALLREAGVILAESNAQATRLAAAALSKQKVTG